MNIKTVQMEDIIISKAYKKSRPRPEKVVYYRAYWDMHGKTCSNIVVDKHNVLQDGYIQYLILKEAGVKEVVVEESERLDTEYVYGNHMNSKCRKIYVWKVPKWWNGVNGKIKEGDFLLAMTAYGPAPIKVIRLEGYSSPTTEMEVKSVLGKLPNDVCVSREVVKKIQR